MIASAVERQPRYDALPFFRGVKAKDIQNAPDVDIVAVLPRGEAIRNFVQTGTLDLIASESELTIITVVPNDDLLLSLRKRYDRVLALDETVERYFLRILRELIDLAHGRHLWSAAAQERWRLRDAEADTLAKRLKRSGKKLASMPFATARGVLLLESLERAASRTLAPSAHYKNLFRSLRPAVVFNGSHVHSNVAIQAIRAAQFLGIPTATFIFSWDNLTSQGRIFPAYDYYLVWNEDIKQELLRIYPRISANSVFVTGTPQFDFHFRPDCYWTREEFCRKTGARPNQPIVLYSTGMANHMPGEPLVVEQIADVLSEMSDLGHPQLLVRVYPKDRSGRFEDLKRRRPDIVFPDARWVDAWLTPTEEDNQMLTNTLRHVDVGINVASTISLELCMFDKPVVNIAYNPPGMAALRVPYARYYEYDHYRTVVDSGAVSIARSPEEMRAHLRDALNSPGTRHPQRSALMKRMFGDTLDGRSSERVARALLALVSTRGPHNA
jgi:hypothetical protein